MHEINTIPPIRVLNYHYKKKRITCYDKTQTAKLTQQKQKQNTPQNL